MFDDEMKEIHVIKDVPKYSLREQMEQRTDDVLRVIAEEPEINVNSELTRSALIDEIAKKLADPEVLRMHLSEYRRREFEFFCEAAKYREYRKDGLTFGEYGLPYHNLLLSLYSDSEGYFCVIPQEIRDTFEDLKRDSFLSDWGRLSLLRTYGRAASELYGVIKVADIVDIFNAQNIEPTDEEEFTQAISEHCREFQGVVVEEEYLLCEFKFENSDWDEIENFAREAGRRPRYVPSRDEILTIGAEDYWPETPQSKAVEDFLESTFCDKLKPQDMEEIVFDLMFLFQRKKWRLNDMAQITNNATSLMRESQARQFLSLVMDMANNTRSWLNNGHTPNELFERREQPNMLSLPNEPFKFATTPKVGRNEPCPCGSGQKYKRCCGNSLNN